MEEPHALLARSTLLMQQTSPMFVHLSKLLNNRPGGHLQTCKIISHFPVGKLYAQSSLGAERMKEALGESASGGSNRIALLS